MRFLFLFFSVFMLPQVTAAQSDTLFGAGYLSPAPLDTLRTKPDAAAWQQLTEKKEYAVYQNEVEFRDVAKEEKNLDQGISFISRLIRFFGTVAGRLLLLILFTTLLVWLGYRWTKNRGGLFYSNKKFSNSGLQSQEPEDLVQDWAFKMKQALAQQDYRMAIRFGYLNLLQLLDEQGRIAYHPNKTNRDYAAAIRQPELQTLFQKISRQYERTWYGYRPAQAADFEFFQQQSELLKTKSAA